MDGRMISLPSGKKVKVAQLVKNPPAMQETLVRFLGWDDPLEEDVVTHSWILAWRVPLDRGAWRATVHGVTKSQTRLTKHTTTQEGKVKALHEREVCARLERGNLGGCKYMLVCPLALLE